MKEQFLNHVIHNRKTRYFRFRFIMAGRDLNTARRPLLLSEHE